MTRDTRKVDNTLVMAACILGIVVIVAIVHLARGPEPHPDRRHNPKHYRSDR